MLCTKIVLLFLFWHSKNICTQDVVNLYFSWNSMNNLLSYCGLTDARMRASEKDLPVITEFIPFRLPVSNGYQIVKLCSSSWLLTSLIILSLKASAVISSISWLNFCKFRILFNMQSFGNGLLLMSHWVDVFLLGKKFKSSGLTWVCPREKVLRMI